jgi:hypothetical protein
MSDRGPPKLKFKIVPQGNDVNSDPSEWEANTYSAPPREFHLKRAESGERKKGASSLVQKQGR